MDLRVGAGDGLGRAGDGEGTVGEGTAADGEGKLSTAAGRAVRHSIAHGSGPSL